MFKLSYYRNYDIDCNQILDSDKDHDVHFMGGPNMPQKSKIADGRHLEKTQKSQYLCNSLTDFDKIWHSNASQPSTYTHTHTQPFYGPLGYYQGLTG